MYLINVCALQFNRKVNLFLITQIAFIYLFFSWTFPLMHYLWLYRYANECLNIDIYIYFAAEKTLTERANNQVWYIYAFIYLLHSL